LKGSTPRARTLAHGLRQSSINLPCVGLVRAPFSLSSIFERICSAMPNPDTNHAVAAGTGDETVMPIVAEEVEISALREETGRVRIRKVVRHEQTAVDTPSHRERVETVRVPKGHPVDRAEGAQQRGTVLVIPVYEERLVRQLILVEEIHVKKWREISQNSQVLPTRREEVVIERFDAATSKWLPEPSDPQPHSEPDLPDR
jgi:stress response protein YsnF